MMLWEQVPELALLPKVQCSADGLAGEAEATAAALCAVALPPATAPPPAGAAGLWEPLRLNRAKLVVSVVGLVADARLLLTIASPRGLRRTPPPKDANGVGLPMLLARRIWWLLPGVAWWPLPALPSTPPRERMLVRREGCVPDLWEGTGGDMGH